MATGGGCCVAAHNINVLLNCLSGNLNVILAVVMNVCRSEMNNHNFVHYSPTPFLYPAILPEREKTNCQKVSEKNRNII